MKITLEAVCTLTTNQIKNWTWNEVKAEINKSDFVNIITGFDTKHLKKSVKEEIFTKYLNLPNWDPE